MPNHSYLVEVKSCADDQCRIRSEPINFTLELGDKHIIRDLSIRNSTAVESPVYAERAAFSIAWRIYPHTESDLCDLSAIRFQWTDVEHQWTHSLAVPVAETCPQLRCGQIDAPSLDCRYELADLDFNTMYSLSLSPIALSGSYEWPTKVITTTTLLLQHLFLNK